MREHRDIMGMPVLVEVVDADDPSAAAELVFSYLRDVDARFSPYKTDSEIARLNRGELSEREWSDEMREVMALAEATRRETDGYFNIKKPDGTLDPSGLVKGWAIRNAARLLRERGYEHFYIEVAGDIQTTGHNAAGEPWRIGILNPLTRADIVKVIAPGERGVATSGTYLRGGHIYDPHAHTEARSPYISLTVIAADVYEADRFATAAFAMGADALPFLASRELEAYAIAADGMATKTTGFSSYEIH